jgi:hypothetical protein
MKKLTIFAVLALACIGGQARAGTDGNHFLESCGAAVRFLDGDKSAASDVEVYGQVMSCLSYVQGFRDATTIIGMFGARIQICMPEGIPNGQLTRIFEKYLREHPEDLHQEGGGLLMIALMKSFPCKK